MSVVMFLSLLVFFIVIVFGGLLAVGYRGSSDERVAIREAKREALAAKSREKIATKALRSIANGAGNPSLEATIALDEIEAIYNKELN